MARRWGVVSKVLIFVFFVSIAIIFLGYRLITSSLPQTSGIIEVAGLSVGVDVYRDSFGVPHIFAQNERDLFFAAGYVTAQDRLWQMDFNRRAAAGRLSEIFGEATIEHDKFLRLWGFRRIADEIARILSPESRAALTAYAAGVNAFIETHQGRLPIEFSLLGYKPEAWQIEDSIAFTRLMAWKLSFSWYVDLMLQELVEKVGVHKAREVFPDFPKEAPLIVQDRDLWSQTRGLLDAGMQVREFFGIGSGSVGSNSWVVSGEKTDCGKPILANDPHLELRAPSVWYEIHLSGGDIDVAGVSLPGVPGVVIGHNRDIAWGLTNGMVDDVDFYVERINPDNRNQYWDGRDWLDFEVIEEDIRVKDQARVKLQIKFSRNGQIVSDLHPVSRGRNKVVAMRWVGSTPSDELAAYMNLLKAGNWDEFTAALRGFKVPAQNFLFASQSGDIGYYLGGSIPIRRNATGILPHQGWLSAGQWTGEVPFEERPHVFNPASGYIATANNKIVSDRYPYYISNLWEPSGRIARIHEMLSAPAVFSVDNFKRMQLDVESVVAKSLLPIILQHVEAKLDSNEKSELGTLYRLIKDWNGVETPDRIEPAIFHAFLIKFAENTIRDEMGDELYQHYIRTNNVPFRVVTALLRKEHSVWFDDISTEKVESKTDIVVESLLDAGRLLRQMAGESIADWRWGEIHQLTMAHPLGVQKPLDFFLNIGPMQRGGSTMTINSAEYRFRAPFTSDVGPSTRQIVDLCDTAHAWSVITTGASGQRMSKHYKDQTPLWVAGDYHPMMMERAEVIKDASEHLVLSP